MRVAESAGDPLETVTLGLGLLIAQNFIVTNQFFDEKEIRSYLVLRRQFHGDFIAACTALADSFEQGAFGQAVKPASQALRAISRFGPRQEQQALRHFSRAMRGLRRLTHRDVDDPRIFKLLHIAKQLEGIGAGEFDYYSHKSSIENYLTMLIKVPSVPAKIRTLLRKVIKMPLPNAGVMDTANAGAWFDMAGDTKESLRTAVTELEAQQEQIFQKITDPDARSEAYKRVTRKLQKVQNVAGVNVGLIKQQDAVSIEQLLKQEAKLTVDGPTEFLRLQLEQQVRETARYQYNRKEGEPLPREVSKLLTQLRKAKTFSTASRILNDASQRKILRMHDKDLTSILKRAGKNRAVREGKPLTPLHYTPKTAEEFQAEHDTGRIIFDVEFTEEEQKELLGRVSRAVSDLEIVYGKGFCGAHKKKLEFRFSKGFSGTASAHYFVWDNKSNWQPRVTFGPEYQGLLAHELSHYLEDLLAYKLEQEREAQDPPTPERVKERQKHNYENLGGNVFGLTGIPLSRFGEEGSLSRNRELISKSAPEFVEFVDAVLSSADYKRWEDKLGSAYDTALPRAIANLAGVKSYYDLPKEHPYNGLVEKAQYRSELPPEVNEEVKKVFGDLMDGDTRKLSYYNSSTEVWARMCEQYVYNKLIEAGISNPWLTQLTYDIDDNDVYMDEKTFDETVRPILDRLFARMKGRQILARVLARYRSTSSARRVLARSGRLPLL
jgi:hypothetical protein